MGLLYRKIAQHVPGLSVKLLQARLNESEEEYIRRTFFSAFYMSLGLVFVAFFFFQSPFVLVILPIVFPLMFLYFLNYVDVKIKKLSDGIAKEIIFAGRFLIIEIESGVPLYDALVSVAQNYPVIGIYLQEVVDKVNLGTPIEDALNEAINVVPSQNLRKMLWQLLNSMKTGSDVTRSLNVVIEQIVREQQIAVKEYGRKLNPMAMFYMMIAIIVPSLGTTMLVVLATFIGLHLSLTILLVITALIGLVQFMFLSMIKTLRPPMEL